MLLLAQQEWGYLCAESLTCTACRQLCDPLALGIDAGVCIQTCCSKDIIKSKHLLDLHEVENKAM